MTYNEQETTWSNLKQAVNELKWPMTSKAQPTTTWIYQQWIKEDPNDQQQADFEIILQ